MVYTCCKRLLTCFVLLWVLKAIPSIFPVVGWPQDGLFVLLLPPRTAFLCIDPSAFVFIWHFNQARRESTVGLSVSVSLFHSLSLARLLNRSLALDFFSISLSLSLAFRLLSLWLSISISISGPLPSQEVVLKSPMINPPMGIIWHLKRH